MSAALAAVGHVIELQWLSRDQMQKGMCCLCRAADAIARRLTRLETLALPLPPGLSSTAIAALAALPRLRDLDVAHCSRAAGPMLEALAAATKLTRLAIAVHQVSNETDLQTQVPAHYSKP